MLPPQLLRATPRSVRLSNAGIATVVALAALVVAVGFGARAVYSHAAASSHEVVRFASEAVPASAEVTDVQHRGSRDDRRIVIHYRYLVGSRQLTGTTTMREQDQDRYPVGSRVNIHYLVSEPGSSWMEGFGPRQQPSWPAAILILACALIVLGVVLRIRRQADLLANGRLAQATVTTVEKKRGQHGTTWRVTYQWHMLSGAIRSSRYEASGRPPIVGTSIPLLYDRDEPVRQRVYPFDLVKLKLEE